MSTEADARMILKDAGWEITNKAKVSTEEPSIDGRADYLLKNTQTQPPAVIEAKRWLANLEALIGTRTRVGNCSIARVRMGAERYYRTP